MHVAGRARAGFFPTPPTVLSGIRRFIENESGQLGRMLDPCAGNGIPLGFLAKEWKLDAFAIELDRQRAQQCTTQVTKTLRSDAHCCEVSRDAFSALFLNPPYDHAGQGERTELLWLKRWTPMLQPGGLLIYIIPEHQYTEQVLYYLSAYFRDVTLYRFPQDDYQAFKQTVFIGKRVRTANPSESVRRQLWKMLREQSVPTLPDEAIPTPYTIPPPSIRGEIVFRTSWLDPLDMYREAHEQGLWQDAHVRDLLTFPIQHTVKPLLPLRKGHLTRLISAGLYNNMTIEQNGQRWLIKGRARKITRELPPLVEVIDTKDGPEERCQFRTIESYVPELRAVDLTPGPTYGRYIVIEC